MGCILASFYYHDKLILTGAAYETAVAGSTKAREKDGVKAGQLESLFGQRVKGKCILTSNARANVKVGKDEIEVYAYCFPRAHEDIRGKKGGSHRTREAY